MGLSKFAFTVARSNEKWVGGIVGVVTGLISAATGVQVIPSMPFLQAIGMEKDELVQALGVFFTVATLALVDQSHHLRPAQRLDRAARRNRDGLLLCRHVHRPGGALADAGGSVPPLVPDRDDLSRALSRGQRDLQASSGLKSLWPEVSRLSMAMRAPR